MLELLQSLLFICFSYHLAYILYIFISFFATKSINISAIKKIQNEHLHLFMYQNEHAHLFIYKNIEFLK